MTGRFNLSDEFGKKTFPTKPALTIYENGTTLICYILKVGPACVRRSNYIT